MDERTYDIIQNEGHRDGYNPIRAAREEKEAAEASAEAHAYAQTTQGKIAALYRRIELECGSVAREWGNTHQIAALQTTLYAEIETLKAQLNAEFLQIWTLEITQARRKEWNEMVTSGKFGRIGSRMNFRDLRAQEVAQGWVLEDLKKAIKLNNL